MKILICNIKYPAGATYYWHDDIINTLKRLGHTVEKYKNNLDHWFEFKPDLYIGIHCFIEKIPDRKKREKCKILMGVNFSKNVFTDEMFKKYDYIRQNYNIYKRNNEWIKQVKPDTIFTWSHENLTKICYNKWLELYPNCIDTIQAGNPFIYNKKDKNDYFDFGYVGGRWSYKAIIINKLFLPILNKFNKFEIYGSGWDGIKNYKGPIGKNGSKEEECNFYNKCKIVPCFTEPHTITHGVDLPDRLYKASLCGALVIHNDVYKIKEVFPDIITFKTSQELENLIQYYLKNEIERIKLAEKQRKHILNNHTYLHRFKKLFNILNLEDEEKNIDLHIKNLS